MDDGIIKGTGNSRFLKSVSDFLSQYPTYQDFVAALAAGTLPVDFNGINETGWQQLGTALNKGNLLSDETAAMYGMDETATLDEAFALVATRAPVGTILWYAAKTAPAGYLICDGAAVSRTDYAALFAIIGTTFGTGDGSTTFLLPDLRAAFVRGAGNQDGYSATFGGKQNATTIYSLNQNYRATGSQNIFGSDKTTPNVNVYGVEGRNNFQTAEGTMAYAVRPYNIALTPIIKY